MTPGSIAWACFIFWTTGVCECVLITQWPRDIISSSSAEMHCYQNNTDYEYLYWYRQLSGGQIQLIVYLVAGNANFEPDFKSGFKAERSQTKQWSLTVSSVQQKDEVVYLCAARTDYGDPAYFGKGTKLTVLEKDIEITPPTVKILGPSNKECKDNKGKKKKTLVCVASGFYPDHVTVSWEHNDQNIPKDFRVSTDAAAKRDGKYYKITSRLIVPIEVWVKPNKFMCIVSFFNGTDNIKENATLITKGIDNPGTTREDYIKISQNAKLSFSVLIVKSCLYAALVCFLVWKLQGKRGKQTK